MLCESIENENLRANIIYFIINTDLVDIYKKLNGCSVNNRTQYKILIIYILFLEFAP